MFIVPCLKDKNHTFTQVSKSFINDSRLLMKTRFLLIFLISKPSSWVFNYPDILKSCPEGIYSIRSSIRELIKFGYISHKQDRLPNHRFSYSHYMISETPVFFTPIKTAPPPHIDFPHAAPPHAAPPHTNSQLPLKNKIKKHEDKKTATSPTKVVNTYAAAISSFSKKEIKDALSFLSSLGITDPKSIIAKYSFNVILEYAKGFESKIKIAYYPVAFLVCAIKEKWEIPSAESIDPALLCIQHFCSSCGRNFSYLDYKQTRKICPKCEKKQ